MTKAISVPKGNRENFSKISYLYFFLQYRQGKAKISRTIDPYCSQSIHPCNKIIVVDKSGFLPESLLSFFVVTHYDIITSS